MSTVFTYPASSARSFALIHIGSLHTASKGGFAERGREASDTASDLAHRCDSLLGPTGRAEPRDKRPRLRYAAVALSLSALGRTLLTLDAECL
jgi:hypothetical protein